MVYLESFFQIQSIQQPSEPNLRLKEAFLNRNCECTKRHFIGIFLHLNQHGGMKYLNLILSCSRKLKVDLNLKTPTYSLVLMI